MAGGPWGGGDWETCQEEALPAPPSTGSDPARLPPNPGLCERPIHGRPQGEPQEPPSQVRGPAHWHNGAHVPLCPAGAKAGSGVRHLGGSGEAPPPGTRLAYPRPEGAPCPVPSPPPWTASPGRGRDGRRAVPKPAHSAPGPSRGGHAPAPQPTGPRQPWLLSCKPQGPPPVPRGCSPERPGCLAMGRETSVSGRTYTSGPF